MNVESVRIVAAVALVVTAMLVAITAPDRAGKLATHLIAAACVALVAAGILAL